MDELIPYAKVLEHERLVERLADLRPVVLSASADGPALTASPALVMASADLLRCIYRLISRESFARTLPRLDPAAPPNHRQLVGMLRDAALALELFRDAHIDHHLSSYGEWLTLDE